MSSLFASTTNLERFRRIRGYAEAHLQALVAGGVSAKEIASVRADISAFAEIVALDYVYPLDTPAVDDPPHVEQPLCPDGTYEEMSVIIDQLMEVEE